MSLYTSELAESLSSDLLDRFLRYVQVHTTSKPNRTKSPSTDCQLDLARLLKDELVEAGLTEVDLDENGYVMATLPGNAPAGAPVIGLLAHIDTSPDAPGDGVKPIVHRGYEGVRVELPLNGTVLDPESMPMLKKKVGHDIVTTSGDTLLGADDKAGMSEIMTAVKYLAANPGLPRPTITGVFHSR